MQSVRQGTKKNEINKQIDRYNQRKASATITTDWNKTEGVELKKKPFSCFETW